MKHQQIQLSWKTGCNDTKEGKPDNFVPATVPGAVQLDIAKAENYGDYWYGSNWKDYLWMEDKYWTYRTEFEKPGLENDEGLLFVTKGIDYQYEILLNGELLYAYEGMFRPLELDITDRLAAKNVLEVVIFPVPKSQIKRQDRTQADQSCKPAVSYGWDWHPRLIPLGIWDDTFLQIVPHCRIKKSELQYSLSGCLKHADINLRIKTTQYCEGISFCWKLKNPAGETVFQKEGMIDKSDISIVAKVENIQLWWPHTYGNQTLYTSEIELVKDNQVVDKHLKRTGFRKVQLVMNEGTWDEPSDFPKSRSHPPITVQINGKRIFTKGSNWVPPELFPGTITKERYHELLDKAVEANLDMLRVWGGGIVNKNSFYELCDEKGLLVWQEFPLACNDYRGTDTYLKVLENEAIAIIERIREHACLALWCGGNELFNVWSGMTDQYLALRLLNTLCYDLDKNTPFLPTAPVAGMGHGPYGFLDPVTKEEIFVKMMHAQNTAYSECSSTGPASVEVLKTFIPENELFPPKPGAIWEDHHAFGAWDAEPDSHLLLSMLERYFGKADTLEELVGNGQFIQIAGMQCLFEEGRRQKPYCSMVLTWCYNEPWPCAAGGSAISWPLEPKPAYYAMKQSCRPVLASAQIKKLVWEEGEVFESTIWLLNDSFAEVKPVDIKVIIAGDERTGTLTWHCPGAAVNTNTPGPKVKCVLPKWNCERFMVILKVPDYPELESEYELLYHKKEHFKDGEKGMNV